jgi:hypothetical protein
MDGTDFAKLDIEGRSSTLLWVVVRDATQRAAWALIAV